MQIQGVILAEPSQIHQVIMNLCTNAFYSMQKTGGILEVNLTNQDLGSKGFRRITDLAPGSYLELTVKDTGQGIDQAVIARIFDPYFTTKPKEDGTGLGLSVVLGIIESLNGRITVNSEPGKGTTCHQTRLMWFFLMCACPMETGWMHCRRFAPCPQHRKSLSLPARGPLMALSLAIESGAWDYVEKPFSAKSVALHLTRVLQYREGKNPQKAEYYLKGKASSEKADKSDRALIL